MGTACHNTSKLCPGSDDHLCDWSDQDGSDPHSFEQEVTVGRREGAIKVIWEKHCHKWEAVEKQVGGLEREGSVTLRA